MKKQLISLAMGLIILGLLIWSINPKKFFELIKTTKIEYFLLAGVFYFAQDLFQMLKLKIVFKKSKPLKLFFSHMSGMLFSNITPARAGYFYTVYSLSKRGIGSVDKNTGSIIWLQGIMVLIKIFCLGSAFFYLSLSIKIPVYLLLAFIPLVGLVVISFIILYTKMPNKILKKIPLVNKAVKYLDRIQEAIKHLKVSDIAWIIVFDLIAWVLLGFQVFLISKSIGLDIGYLLSLFLHPVLTAIMLIPISPGGLGFTEGGNMLIFKLLGYPSISAVALVVLMRANSITVDSIGLIDLLWKENGKKKD